MDLKLTVPLPKDAMNEVAWCYLEGFGCKKDKVSSLLPQPPACSCDGSLCYVWHGHGMGFV